MFEVPANVADASSSFAATSRALFSLADSSLVSLLTMTISLRRRFLALQSFATAVVGERENDCPVILTRLSEWQQPPWDWRQPHCRGGATAGSTGLGGLPSTASARVHAPQVRAYTGAMDEETTVTVNDIPEGAAIIDVREDDEWEAGHIEGAY